MGWDNPSSSSERVIAELVAASNVGYIGRVSLQDAGGNGESTFTSPADGQGYGPTLPAQAILEVFNGVGWDRFRSASAGNLIAQSGLGAALVAPPGMWSVQSTPAPGAFATAGRSAGGANTRHIAWRYKLTALVTTALAAPAAFNSVLRDGPSGGGTILESSDELGIPNTGVGNTAAVNGQAPLSIPGSLSQAMTAEVNGGTAAGLSQTANLQGYDAS